MSAPTVVETATELLQAVNSAAMDIEVRGAIRGMPMITLHPGVTLRGGTLQFGAKGVRLTRDNTLEGISVLTAEEVDRIAVGGQIRTAGDDVITVDIAGQVGEIAVAGGISATGRNADAIHVHGDVAGLDAIASHARYGQAIVRTG